MNVFGETLAAVLEDRGLSIKELAERANLDADGLVEAATGDGMERLCRASSFLAMARVLDLSEEEHVRLGHAYFAEEWLPDHVVKRLAARKSVEGLE